MAGYLVIPNGLYAASMRVTNKTKRGGVPASAQLRTFMRLQLPYSSPVLLKEYDDTRDYAAGGDALHSIAFTPPWMGDATEFADWRGSVSANVTPPVGQPQIKAATPAELYIASSFYTGLVYAPAGWPYWFPSWWNPVTELWEWPAEGGEYSRPTNYLFNFQTKPAVGLLGFRLGRYVGSVFEQSDWYGSWNAVAFWASIVNYNFNTGQVVVG